MFLVRQILRGLRFLRDRDLQFWGIIVIIISVCISSFGQDMVLRLYEHIFGDRDITEIERQNYSQWIDTLTALVIFASLYIVFRQVHKNSEQNIRELISDLGKTKSSIEEIKKYIEVSISTTEKPEGQLSVVAPAAKWIQTSSWIEIVKKMREMFRMHQWGQIPTLSGLNYMVEVGGNLDKNHANIGNAQAISKITEFLSIDYFQWHGFSFEFPKGLEADLVQDGGGINLTAPYADRFSLKNIIDNLISPFIIIPFDAYARNKDAFGSCTPIYPVSSQLYNLWRNELGYQDNDHDNQLLLSELRRLEWMGPCPDELLNEVLTDPQFRTDFGRIDHLGDFRVRDDHLGREGQEQSKYGPTVFSVFVVYPSLTISRKREVHRIRFVSLFDREGKLNEEVRALFLKFASTRTISLIDGIDYRALGCYVPIKSDLDDFADYVDGLDSYRWAEVRVLYAWSYVHPRRVTSRSDADQVLYLNDSWSFPVSNVAVLRRAEFRATRGVDFRNEFPIIPYTMAPPEETPRRNGNRIVYAENLPMCPSDVFHVNWSYLGEEHYARSVADGVASQVVKLQAQRGSAA